MYVFKKTVITYMRLLIKTKANNAGKQNARRNAYEEIQQ